MMPHSSLIAFNLGRVPLFNRIINICVNHLPCVSLLVLGLRACEPKHCNTESNTQFPMTMPAMHHHTTPTILLSNPSPKAQPPPIGPKILAAEPIDRASP